MNIKNYMNNSKGFIVLPLLIISFLIAGGIIFYFYSKGNLNYTYKQGKNTPAPVVNLSSAKITITQKGFVPSTIKIKKGQSVEWTNNDVKPHQVAPDPHPSHTSLPALGKTDSIEPQGSMSFNFEKSGTYHYHDHLNPLKFQGTVIVE